MLHRAPMPTHPKNACDACACGWLQLLFALGPYADMLDKTGGGMPEFINPKYTDGTKTAFKAPTRLECMMQDYPKSLGPDAAGQCHRVSNEDGAGRGLAAHNNCVLGAMAATAPCEQWASRPCAGRSPSPPSD